MRRHVVTIVAIFAALAVGVVLGSGLLSSGLVSGLRDDKAGLEHDLEVAAQENNRLGEQLNAADGFDGAVAGRVVRDALPGRTVVLVSTPDTDPSDLEGVQHMIESAGGAVTGRLALTDAFVDATGGDRLRTVVNNVIPAGVTLGTGAVDQGSMAGDLIGAVLLTKPDAPAPTEQERTLALDTLRGGGFISYEDGALAPAQSAVVVTGGGAAADTSMPATGNRGAVVARFAGALDGRSAGTVLAGRPESARGNGAVAVARADAALSSGLTTVDDVDRQSGKITVALALQEQSAGGSGRYGSGPGASAVTVGVPMG
nr:copper transporter [Rhodococcus sp. HNM0569]